MPIRRLKRATLAACCGPLLFAVGCSSGDAPDARPTGRAPQTLISDQLHNGGTQGFLFLPPMVPRPAQMGDFVPTVRPTVRIDEVTAAGVTIRTLATFTTTSGPGRERIRTHIADEPCDADDDDGDTDPTGYFYARWKTNNAHLSDAARYRVRVLIPAAGGGTREIGFADVDVVRSQQEFRTVDTVNFAPLRNGQVLRIKFRIDRPAVDGDGDGVFDWVDNCPAQANASQLDSNHDRQGDACECVGVTCVASDVCHAAGVCDPINGMCSNPDAAAGTACTLSNATALCASGACGVASCDAGHADCNATATDGCETPTTTLANCGACGVACTPVAHSTPGCDTGTCAITCDAGWADANGDRADGCELDVTTDANCGVPGNACVSGLGDVNTCVGGSCSTIACASDTANCNTAVGDACEVSLAGDVAHCGACNHACAVANATPSCVASACAVGACNAGYSDCNGLSADGCEITPASDVANCGACGNACSLPNASPVCAAGSCAVGACAEGFVDLDHDASNGCEVNLATNVNHCGAVGNHCVMPNGTAACAGGQCVLASCNAGYDNCTTGAGCESDLSAVTTCGSCGVTCASGEHSTATCGAAGCGLTCETGFGNCDGIAANGCEVDLTSDGGHCGLCTTACGADTTCQSGVCSAPVCTAGVANCNSLAADGCETPTAANVASCGACGNVCSFTNAVPQCNDGACGFDVCTMGYGDCDGSAANGCEVALDTLANCGGCGTACSYAHAAAACANSACALGACDAGWVDCDGIAANGCEASTTSTAHCGGCGNVCSFANASATCSAGACAMGTCNVGYANCDGNAANGCETNVATTASSCGSCGNVCTSAPSGGTAACVAGACVGICPAGQTRLSNFVCVNTSNDPNWCGSSLAHCAAGRVCIAGVCVAEPLTACGGTSPSTLTDVNNCGACGTACAAGQICAAGHCTTPRRGQISNSDNTANLAVRADNGLMLGWGNNGMAVLGGGPTRTTSFYNTAQAAVSSLGAVSAVSTTGNPFFSCALRTSDHQVRCWGNAWTTGTLGCFLGPSLTGTTAAPCANYTFTPGPVWTGPGGTALTAESVTQGSTVAIALLADGTLRSWGNGWLGNGVKENSGLGLTTVSTSAGVPLTGVTAVSALFEHLCALRSDGTAWCWGRNLAGELGDGTYVNRPYAQQMFINATTPLTGVIEVSAGTNNTCAVRTDGTVWCWGGSFGPRPTQIVGITRAVSVAPMSYSSGCALLNDSTVRCFGRNEFGDFGIPSGTSWSFPYATSFAVPGLTGAVALGGGINHRCVLMQDGTARCWGRNHTGQLGNGSLVDSSTPVTVWDFPTAGVR